MVVTDTRDLGVRIDSFFNENSLYRPRFGLVSHFIFPFLRDSIEIQGPVFVSELVNHIRYLFDPCSNFLDDFMGLGRSQGAEHGVHLVQLGSVLAGLYGSYYMNKQKSVSPHMSLLYTSPDKLTIVVRQRSYLENGIVRWLDC